MPRKMRDSGVEWIGQVPEGWGVIHFGQAIERISTGLNPRDNFKLTKEDELYYVTIRNFKNGHLFLDERCDRISKYAWNCIQQRSQLRVGDILFASISDTPQSYLISQSIDNWNINESIFTIRADENLYDKRFFYYQLTTSPFYDSLRIDATGSTFQSIKQNKLLKSSIVHPSKKQQAAIADFLDRHCGEIDVAIESARQSIEDYKVLKKSLVFETVTGKNRSGRKVPSGVDWLGDVPVDWPVCRIVSLYREVSERGDDSLPILSVSINTGVSDKELSDEEQERVFIRSEDKSKYKRVQPGDLTYNMMRAWQGAFGAVRVDGMVSPAYVVARPKAKMDSRYVEYLLRTPNATREMQRYSRGIADFRLRLYWPEFKNIKIPCPPLAEQRALADEIDERCGAIDALVAEKESLIADLEQYKKSLIFECVTGKREVA